MKKLRNKEVHQYAPSLCHVKWKKENIKKPEVFPCRKLNVHIKKKRKHNRKVQNDKSWYVIVANFFLLFKKL